MKFCLTNFELFKRMSEKLSQDPKSSQSTKVRVMQNCENSADGSIPIIVNQNVNEDSNLSHHSALIPVNNFDERTIAEQICKIFSIQHQMRAYQEHIQENLRANSLMFANSRPTSRNHRSRTRIGNGRRNHGQPKLLKLFKSLNKSFKMTVNTLEKLKSLLIQQLEIARSTH